VEARLSAAFNPLIPAKAGTQIKGLGGVQKA
jgi:hypothetical protein